jgi:putative membrane protein
MFDFSWGGWLIGGLMMLLFWGGLIVLALLLFRAFSGSSRSPKTDHPGAGETALDILKKRYARGEISREEYEAIRRHLET